MRTHLDAPDARPMSDGRHRGGNAARQPVDSLCEDLGVRQKAYHQVGFAREIEEVTRVEQRVVAGKKGKRPLLRASHVRASYHGVPSSFGAECFQRRLRAERLSEEPVVLDEPRPDPSLHRGGELKKASGGMLYGGPHR